MALLKIQYLDGLQFKSIEEGVVYKEDFRLKISEEEALEVLEKIRNTVRYKEGTSILTKSKVYEIRAEYYKELVISILENNGQMCRPLGKFKYEGYMGGKHLLEGISSSISELRNEIEQ